MSESNKISKSELRRRRLAALNRQKKKEEEPKTPPSSVAAPAVPAVEPKRKLTPDQKLIIDHARKIYDDFDNLPKKKKKKILKGMSVVMHDGRKEVAVHHSRPKPAYATITPIFQENKKKGNKKKENKEKGNREKENREKLNQMHAAQMAKDQQVYDNAMYAVNTQQGEWQKFYERENEQTARKLQEQFNRDRAIAAAQAANQQARQPRLGCRPDSTNAACVLGGMGAGAVAGSVVPVVGTGIGACVGAACGLGAAVKRRFTGRGRKSRHKGSRKHNRKTRKHKKRHRRRKSTRKHKKKSKKRRRTKKR